MPETMEKTFAPLNHRKDSLMNTDHNTTAKTAELHVIRSRRNTFSMQVSRDGIVIVRAPLRASDAEIHVFVNKNYEWLQKHLQEAAREKLRAAEEGLLTNEDLHKLADEALRVLPERVCYYAKIMGVQYGRITVRNQKTRWGSCSSKGNLNFNCLLMLTPPEVQDYVVVHELAHRIEMNHSPAFWAEVEKILPDYRRHKKWLRDNGGHIMARMTQTQN